jgi:hypothetical protein
MYVQHTCIMEFATSPTFSAMWKTPTAVKSNVPRVLWFGRHFFICISSMLWLRCAGRRLNDLFRGIQLLEWFIQDHSDGWMIHSGPFSCLNDSFKTIQLLEWFIQASQQKSDFSSTSSSLLNYKHSLFQYELQLMQIIVCGKIVQQHSLALMIHSGPFRFLNDSFRTIQVHEWFIQGHVSKRVISSNVGDLDGRRNANDQY